LLFFRRWQFLLGKSLFHREEVLLSVGSSTAAPVKDTGSGIDSDIIPRLFTKFATRSDAGTGLGLYISKNVVETHGGKIWAKNSLSL
jgi:signal transduction histidine kinase